MANKNIKEIGMQNSAKNLLFILLIVCFGFCADFGFGRISVYLSAI